MGTDGGRTQLDRELWVKMVKKWGGFDRAEYARRYSDLKRPFYGLTRHYYKHGMFEDRCPNATVLIDDYKKSRYLEKIPSGPAIINMIRENALELQGYLSYIDPNANPIESILEDWGGFDHDFYLSVNPDVKNSKKDPFEHFCQSGIFECRDPNEAMNVRKYCLDNEEKNFSVAPAILWIIQEENVKKISATTTKKNV